MTKSICLVTVIDPDTHLPVEVEMWKLENSGAMVGIDASILDTDIVLMDPYQRNVEMEVTQEDGGYTGGPVTIYTGGPAGQ